MQTRASRSSLLGLSAWRCVATLLWGLSLHALVACPDGASFDGGSPDAGALAPTRVLALAGPDLEVLEGSRVQLDAHASRVLAEDAPLSLSWSQVEGPPVVLTNPSGPAPAFIAPLSPATLRFRLRAESHDAVAYDEVVVEVLDRVGAPPLFLELPADTTGRPGEATSFRVDVPTGLDEELTFHAETTCPGDPALLVEGNRVSLVLPDALPCAVVVEGVSSTGRKTAKAARVFWPPTTPLARETRMQAPVLVEPGEEVLLRFEREGTAQLTTMRAWPAGGTDEGLSSGTEGALITLSAPRRRTRLVIGGERRRGPTSGGVRYALIEVSAGVGNRAPTAQGGPDRAVRPGALFSLDTGGSSDLDGDSLAIEIRQVLGPQAAADPLQPGVLRAPDVPGTLVFHVTAFDQRVFSEPDTVRVIVDREVASQAPVLELDPVRYVSPGSPFVLDASGAYDPDSGFIERWTITQRADDPVVLLPEPVEAPTLELIAGEDGEVYHFRLSAFDQEGLVATADVEVIVELAGPHVDLSLGTADGDGTALRPFRTLEQALPVAERHRMRELKLGAGEQAPFGGALPPGLSIRGGFVFTGDAWQPGGPASTLRVTSGNLVVTSASLRDLHLTLDAPDVAVELAGVSVLADVTIEEQAAHQGSLLRVREASTTSLERVELRGSALGEGSTAAVHVEPGASLRLSDSTVEGGPGGARTGLLCIGATVDLVRSTIRGSPGAARATGIEAAACDIQVLSSTVVGGSGTEASIGIAAEGTLLFLDPASVIEGAESGETFSATGLDVGGVDAPVVAAGEVRAVGEGAMATRAIGLVARSPRVQVSEARVTARGRDEAMAVRVAAPRIQAMAATLAASSSEGSAVALDVEAPSEVSVDGGVFEATGRTAFGVRSFVEGGLEAPRIQGASIDAIGEDGAAGILLGASRDATLSGLRVQVEAGSAAEPSRGIGVGSGALVASEVHISGDGAVIGIVVATSTTPLVLERTRVRAESRESTATGLLAAAPVELLSSFVHVDGRTDGSVAVEARGAARLTHATLVGGSHALRAASSGALVDAANTLLAGEVGVERSAAAPPLGLMRSVALATNVAYQDASGTLSVTAEDLAEEGLCPDCLNVTLEAVVEEDGHLVDGDNPLVDSGSPDHSLTYDIDGDDRPQGAGPDIGCDERTTSP